MISLSSDPFGTFIEGLSGWNHHWHEWSDELANLKVPMTLADAQVARWQRKYGRDPTGHWQQRSCQWLALEHDTNGHRHDGDRELSTPSSWSLGNLQNMHEIKKPLPPTGARRRMELKYQDWARARLSTTRPGHRGARARDHTQADTLTFKFLSSLSLDFAVHGAFPHAFPSDDSEAGRLSPLEDADSDSQVTTMMCRTIG
jgi:hypothetical protein